MAADSIISVAGLSKRYVLGVTRHDTLRDRIVAGARGLMRRRTAPARLNEFWALRDVSFDVKRGEVVGIVGRNGAGKSTLLKILSRITEPSTGTVTLCGRVASLLEVGTGFHPELTGRENIFLNGAILGMSRAEIRAKFDEIVAFAEVDQFIDTPVKHYSSGMYVRLAFAVAAHLEPEILVVDEVLAVGDAAFQKKCLGKMREVAQGSGRTVLFVSHQMSAVRQLCTSGLLLHRGNVLARGPINEVVAKYEASFSDAQQLRYERAAGRDAKAATLERIEIDGTRAEGMTSFLSRHPIVVKITVTVTRPVPAFQLALRVATLNGQPVYTTTNADAKREIPRLGAGRYQFEVVLPGILAAGPYRLTIAALEPNREVFDLVDEAVGFEIDRVGTLEGELRDDRLGVVEPDVSWEMRKT